MEDKCYIKILKKITDEEFKKIYEACENKPILDITLQDLGVCIKHKLSDEEQARLDEIKAYKEKEQEKQKTNVERNLEKELEKLGVGCPMYVYELVELPEDMKRDSDALRDKIYADFKYAEPGYLDETMEWAESHNIKLKEPIKKGSKIYYDYPLSCVVVAEITEDLTESAQFIKAFCDGYQEIYNLEEDSSSIEAKRICDENPEVGLVNRNRTNGCFGIWGHVIKDLVLEGVDFCDSGKHIFLTIGS